MTRQVRRGLRRRVVEAAGGNLVREMLARIEALEAEVQENRNLNLRIAELVDVVQELLVPVASQDRARIDAALEKFQRSL
ncbi:MAG TPA: DUF6752 domain-containing protein [Marmoricola sp.]